MPTLCRAYATEDEAHAAVARLLEAGLAGEDVRVLMGERARDARDVPAESFAGPARGEAGDFAGHGHASGDAMGAFAGAPGRRGSFADRDRDTVTGFDGGVERVRVAAHHDLHRLLVEAGLEPAAADADVDALHAGRVLVLAAADDARAGAAERALA